MKGRKHNRDHTFEVFEHQEEVSPLKPPPRNRQLGGGNFPRKPSGQTLRRPLGVLPFPTFSLSLSLFFFFFCVLGLPQSSRALWLWCKGLIAQRHVGPQFTNLNQLPLGRRILNHWTSREVPSPSFLNTLSLFMPFPPPEMPFPPTLPSKLLVIFKAPAQHSPPLQTLPQLPYVVISPSHSSWFIPYM